MLGIGIPQAIGHLHLLWWWAMDYAQDGDLADFDGADVADACQWDGEPARLIDALLTCGNPGFLEMCEGTYHIHDWQEYGGKLLEQRQANAERMKVARAKRNEYRAAHVQDTFTTRAGLEESREENSRGEDNAGAGAPAISPQRNGRNGSHGRNSKPTNVEVFGELARQARALGEEPDQRILPPGRP